MPRRLGYDRDQFWRAQAGILQSNRGGAGAGCKIGGEIFASHQGPAQFFSGRWGTGAVRKDAPGVQVKGLEAFAGEIQARPSIGYGN